MPLLYFGQAFWVALLLLLVVMVLAVWPAGSTIEHTFPGQDRHATRGMITPGEAISGAVEL